MRVYIDKGFYFEKELPEHCTLDELNDIISSFTNLYKFMKGMKVTLPKQVNQQVSDGSISASGGYYRDRHPSAIHYKKRTYCNTREKGINIMKLHYFGTSEDKKLFEKNNKMGTFYPSLASEMKIKFNITPEDVGLKRFPTTGDYAGNVPFSFEKKMKILRTMQSDPNQKVTFSTESQVDETDPLTEQSSEQKESKMTRKYIKSGVYSRANGYKVEAPKIDKKGQGLGGHLKTRTWCDTREKTINLLRIHYTGTREQKEELSKQAGIPWLSMMKAFLTIRERYGITPEEVGLSRWPMKGEAMVKSEKKDYILPIPEAPLNQSPPVSPPTILIPIPFKPQSVKTNSQGYEIYSLGALGSMGWDRLETLAFEWGVNSEVIKGCRINDDRETLIVELRKEMRQMENKINKTDHQ